MDPITRPKPDFCVQVGSDHSGSWVNPYPCTPLILTPENADTGHRRNSLTTFCVLFPFFFGRAWNFLFFLSTACIFLRQIFWSCGFFIRVKLWARHSFLLSMSCGLGLSYAGQDSFSFFFSLLIKPHLCFSYFTVILI